MKRTLTHRILLINAISSTFSRCQRMCVFHYKLCNNPFTRTYFPHQNHCPATNPCLRPLPYNLFTFVGHSVTFSVANKSPSNSSSITPWSWELTYTYDESNTFSICIIECMCCSFGLKEMQPTLFSSIVLLLICTTVAFPTVSTLMEPSIPNSTAATKDLLYKIFIARLYSIEQYKIDDILFHWRQKLWNKRITTILS